MFFSFWSLSPSCSPIYLMSLRPRETHSTKGIKNPIITERSSYLHDLGSFVFRVSRYGVTLDPWQEKHEKVPVQRLLINEVKRGQMKGRGYHLKSQAWRNGQVLTHDAWMSSHNRLVFHSQIEKCQGAGTCVEIWVLTMLCRDLQSLS